MEKNEDENKFFCNKCSFTCNLSEKLEEHVKNENHIVEKKRNKRSIAFDELLECKYCDYITRVPTTFKQHYLTRHATVEEKRKGFTYYCETCNFGALISSVYETHINTYKHKYFQTLNNNKNESDTTTNS